MKTKLFNKLMQSVMEIGSKGKDRGYYHCDNCDLTIEGGRITIVKAGVTYANGEHAPCPNCGKENLIDRN